jgi:hypothetical protein
MINKETTKETGGFMERKKTMKTKRNWRKIIGIILFVTLVASIVHVTIMLFLSPQEGSSTERHALFKSDYTLMLIQCILGLIVMMVPSFIERKWSIDIPNYMYILYFIFLYCAIYLGEVRSFYYLIPHWDTVLHAFSGAMLGALGFSLISILNNTKSIRVKLSPFFVSLFAFCFAVAVGTLWEIYEYTVDSLLALNMQKYMTADGMPLIGQKALADTMKDLIVDTCSALAISAIGYGINKSDTRADEDAGFLNEEYTILNTNEGDY